MSTVTLGRTVHYQTGSGETFAAIVAEVKNEGRVILCVFNPNAANAPLYTVAEEVTQGDKQAGWYWPPRV